LHFTAVWPKDEGNVLAGLGMMTMEKEIYEQSLQPGVESGERTAVVYKAKIP